MKKVSVLIPSYNHERFLTACLDSIFGQTYGDLEVVLVDDGSTDGSVALAQAYAQREPRLRVFQNERNLGTYGTEQRALELATGELVAVMNSDDLWHREKLSRQVEMLASQPDVPLCYVLGAMVDAHGRPIAREDVHADWPRTERQEVLPYLLYENRILASGVLFRRETLRFETSCRYSGDWVALLEGARHHPVACVPEGLTFWRQHDHNTYVRSVNQMREEIRLRRAIAARGERWLRPGLEPAAVAEGLTKNAMNLVALYVYFGDLAQARRTGLAALPQAKNKRAMLKRTLAAFLPREQARARLWREEASLPTFDSLASALQDIPSLELREGSFTNS